MMACIENICANDKCDFYKFENEVMKMCPRCGGAMLTYFDEELDFPDMPEVIDADYDEED